MRLGPGPLTWRERWRPDADTVARHASRGHLRGGKAEAALAGAGASVGRPCGPTALQRFALASRRTTRGVRCAHSAQTRSTSQFTKRVSTRADARPNLFRRHLLTARTGQGGLGFAAAWVAGQDDAGIDCIGLLAIGRVHGHVELQMP